MGPQCLKFLFHADNLVLETLELAELGMTTNPDNVSKLPSEFSDSYLIS